MIACYNHPDQAAVVLLDWNEDGAEYCAKCIVPELHALAAAGVQANCDEPVIHISLVGRDA
jgi:hypothetical protein